MGIIFCYHKFCVFCQAYIDILFCALQMKYIALVVQA